MATFQKRTTAAGAVRFRVQIRREGEKPLSKTFERMADARAWATATERRLDLGDVASPRKPQGLVSDLLNTYERSAAQNGLFWGRSKQYELNCLRRDLGGDAVAHLTKQRAINYALQLTATMGGPGIATRLGYLAEVMRAARDLWDATVPIGELEEAIAALHRRGILHRPAPRTRRPSADELKALRTYADAQGPRAQIDLGAVLDVLSILPLRIGELVGIEWPNIDATARTVLLRARKHPDPKIKAVNDEVVPLPVVAGVDTFELVAGRPRHLPRPYPWHAHSVSSAFWLAVKSCGIHDLHLHDLRAHGISTLLEAGIPVPMVASISGHKDWKVLQRHYARLDPGKVGAAIASATAVAPVAPLSVTAVAE